ncbi:MAG: InlB B-repeat-containing protein [Paludibacteraceae bacterium]|nr:InlB B-repeat-containing protein [Paludibacteraceae bacterium]
MKKINFKFQKSLLVLIGVLIVGVNQMKAATQIDLYVSAIDMFRTTWDYSTSEIKYAYNCNTDNGNYWTGHQGATEKTSYTYHSFPVYRCVIWSSTNYAEIYVYHYKNGSNVSGGGQPVGTGWINFSGYNNQIFVGNDGSGNGQFVSSPTWDTQETITIYYALANTENYSIKANARISSDYEVWEKVEMENTGKTFDGKKIYKCDLTIYRGGLQHLEFIREDGSTYIDKVMPINNSWTSTATFSGKLYYNSAWRPFGEKRTYDGSTYIYWKTSGGSIPSGWDTGSNNAGIQLVTVVNGNYTYSGFQNGESIGDGMYRYLVPAGTYADIVEVKGKNGNYSGEFGFPSETEKNLIYDYNNQGKWGSWSTTWFARNAYIYMDNTASGWSTVSGYNKILIGRATTNIYSRTYPLKSISNTKLLCYDGAFTFNDYNQLCFIHTTSDDWGELSGADDYPGKRKTYAANHTNEVAYLMDGGSKTYNLFTPANAGSGSSYPTPSHSSASTYSGLLHSTQTVNVEVSFDNGSNYATAAKAPATVTLHSYALTNATTSAASNATDITVDATTVETTTTAVRTATTTLGYSDKKSGYTFVGWFKDGTSQGTGTTLTYYPTTATTHTARFKANRYTITLNDEGGSGGSGSVTATYDTNSNLTSAVSVPSNGDYTFAGYYTKANGYGLQIIDKDGNWNSNVTGYLSSGNWVKADNVTLHARWKSCDDYTFHDGTEDAEDWTATCFEQVGSTHQWEANYTIPNKPNFYVGYNEDFVSSDLGSNGSQSVMTAMTSLRLAPGSASLGTATGATGKLIITDNSSADNLNVEFLPSGYALAYNGGTINLSSTATENIWESNSVTLSAEDVSGTFKIRLRTSDSYVDCGLSAAESAATVGGRNGVTMKSGMTGKFQIDISSDADNFGLKFLPVHTVFFINEKGSATNQSVAHGEKITTTPSDPTTTGYYFGGWYREAGCSNAWDFENNVVTKDTILYAKWTAETYTITLNDRNATSAGTESVTVTYNNGYLSESIDNPSKWGNTFGGWVNGDGTVIINTSGGLVTGVKDYTDGSGNWTRDVGANGATLTLYAKWTPKEHLYWIPGNTSSDVGNVSGAVEFTSAGGGKYYVKIDTDKDQLFHLGDGSNAAGPATPANTDHTQFTLASSASELGSNAYWFKQTGSKQTIIYVLDIDNLTLDFENFVIYKPGDKAADTHTAYGSEEGFDGTIYGTFEYRMPVTALNTWSTLYLPFTPSKVQVYDNSYSEYYDIFPCHRKSTDNLLYQGYYVIRKPEKTTNWPIKDFKNWLDPSESEYEGWVPTANTPYIILWQMPYFENKYISFWGNGVTIDDKFSAGDAPDQDSVLNVLGNGTMATGSVVGAYVLADDYGDGAWLRNENVEAPSSVGPFECYILANSATTTLFPVIGRRTQDETPTGLENIPSLSSEPYKVMIDGQLYIIRDGRMYDATGRAVKASNR